jgi:lipid-A-disaccharide synthase-like uncharacterized protein
MILKRERGSAGAILFALLFVAQWLLYATAIANVWLGVVFANMAMLGLLFAIPYWFFDLDKDFTGECGEMFKSGFAKIFFPSVMLYSAPPIIGFFSVTFIRLFFLNEVMLKPHEIAEKYLHWTGVHRAMSWVLLLGWLYHIARFDLKLQFSRFIRGESYYDERANQISAVVEGYLYLAYGIIALYATVKMIQFDIGFL